MTILTRGLAYSPAMATERDSTEGWPVGVSDASAVLPYAPRFTRDPLLPGSADQSLAGSPRSIAGEYDAVAGPLVPSFRKYAAGESRCTSFETAPA